MKALKTQRSRETRGQEGQSLETDLTETYQSMMHGETMIDRYSRVVVSKHASERFGSFQVISLRHSAYPHQLRLALMVPVSITLRTTTSIPSTLQTSDRLTSITVLIDQKEMLTINQIRTSGSHLIRERRDGLQFKSSGRVLNQPSSECFAKTRLTSVSSECGLDNSSRKQQIREIPTKLTSKVQPKDSEVKLTFVLETLTRLER